MGNLTSSSFLVALSGIVIVFIMLAVLCFMIPLISKAVLAVQKPQLNNRVAPTTRPKTEPAKQPAITGVAGEVALIDVDEKTAACIMAIVSHETGIPLSELIFKSIKAI